MSATGGEHWTTRWRVRGVEGGTIAEITDDNGNNWGEIGAASDVNPESNNPDLWAKVTPGTDICWKAEMETSDDTATPTIYAPIVWEAGNEPVVVLHPVPGWFYVTTPSFTWDFNDPDGDDQAEFQIQIKSEVYGKKSVYLYKLNKDIPPSSAGGVTL